MFCEFVGSNIISLRLPERRTSYKNKGNTRNRFCRETRERRVVSNLPLNTPMVNAHASILVMRGESIMAVSKRLGHKKRRITVSRTKKQTPRMRVYQEFQWWSEADLNRRHADFQSAALPTELPDQVVCATMFKRRWLL